MGCLPPFSTGDSDFATIHCMFNDSGQYFVPKVAAKSQDKMSKPGPRDTVSEHLWSYGPLPVISTYNPIYRMYPIYNQL